MRAIIDATGYRSEIGSLLNYRPSPLLTVCNKTIISYVLDTLSPLKISEYEILLSHLPDQIETAIGEGDRWGIKINYHLLRDPNLLFARMRTIARHWGEDCNVFLASGDGLPDLLGLSPAVESEKPLLWIYPPHRWSGWGILPAHLIARLDASTSPKQLLEKLPEKVNICITEPLINSNSLYELQKSNRRMLKDEPPALHFTPTSRKQDKGVWFSRGVLLHPTVKIIPPIFIGENTQVRNNCQIGPFAVIEGHCLIDSNSKIDNSLVLQRSYVGEGLQIQNCIVDRNLLINLSIKSTVSFRDDFILCEMAPLSPLQSLMRGIARVIAAIVAFLLIPFYLIMLYHYEITHSQVMSLPAKNDPAQWISFPLYSFTKKPQSKGFHWQKHFEKLPQLFNVIRGELHFVGLSPRSIEEVMDLPPDWRKLYLHGKAGIISLAEVEGLENHPNDDLYTAEAYYAVHMGIRNDIAILWKWFKKHLRNCNAQS